MNILFLMADQFRLDALHHIGGYGRTDALDALAAPRPKSGQRARSASTRGERRANH